MHDLDYSVNSFMVHYDRSGNPLSLTLKNQILMIGLVPYVASIPKLFYFFTVYMFSLSKSTSHDLFDVVFPCQDGLMVCSQAAVL